MKRILSSLLIALIAVTAYAAERSLTLKGAINSIYVSAGVDVKYVPGNSPARVSITGPKEYVGNVEVTLREGRLHITSKRETKNKFLGLVKLTGNKRLKGVKVTLYAPPVANIEVSSGAELQAVAPINLPGKAATLSASSGSDLEIEWLKCESLECSSSSGADIEIDLLTVRTASFDSSSGSDIDVDSLTAEEVKASSSSGGDVSLGGAAQRANLRASSGGSVNARKLTCPAVNAKGSSGGSVKTR